MNMQRAREAPGIYCAVGVPPAGVDQQTRHGGARLRREVYTGSAPWGRSAHDGEGVVGLLDAAAAQRGDDVAERRAAVARLLRVTWLGLGWARVRVWIRVRVWVRIRVWVRVRP